ncbi:MAG TPA: hypothetical protein VMS43_17625 [Allosphingosinicella sp.]|nr:hypothetical protein [Allosphingosinicella sp.]
MALRFRPLCCLGFALLAGACNRGESSANSVSGVNLTTPASGAAPAPATDLAGARQRIDAIYAPYTRGATSDYSRNFTPELNAAIDAADQVGIDADPFCDCQDFGRMTYRVDSLEPSADGAVARVAIANFGDRKTIVIRLVRRGEAWLVADVGEGADSLARRFAR